MKVVIGGSTGFLGTEVLRQALQHPLTTSVVALARRDTGLPLDIDSTAAQLKFKSVACSDFSSYPQDVKDEIADADACIWLIAITPTKSKTYAWEQVRTICSDYALSAVDTFAKLPRDGKSEPVRFVYVSGSGAERDASKKPWIMGDYLVMRGQVEKQILERAQLSDGRMQACVAKPGLISPPDLGILKKASRTLMSSLFGFPLIDKTEMAAALLDQAVNGFAKDTLTNGELAEIGRKALEKAGTSE
ncbi:hypothetical protein F66182_6026 [Fusarium sp. NRRL 66182]|nr:hypothetical protein F66182_6026 [Fusarium sp. NRRL 66182]